MSSKLFSPLLLLLLLGHASAQGPQSSEPVKTVEVPIVIPSVSELFERQKRQATNDYIKSLKLNDPDIIDGKLKLPVPEPRLALAVRYLFGTTEFVKAVVEIQGSQRVVQSGDKIGDFQVRVTTQGVSLLITRNGGKEGWSEPLRPGFQREFF